MQSMETAVGLMESEIRLNREPLILNWMRDVSVLDSKDVVAARKHNTMVDPTNRFLEHMVPFACTSDTKVGVPGSPVVLSRDLDDACIYAFNTETNDEFEVFADRYKDSKAFRPWAAKKRDSDRLTRAYGDIADRWAEELLDLTGISMSAKEIGASEDGSIEKAFLGSKDGVDPREVKDRAVAAAMAEVERCRIVYERMRYNVAYEYGKKLTVGDLKWKKRSFDERLTAAWCSIMRIPKKTYLSVPVTAGMRETDRIKYEIIDTLRENERFLMEREDDLLVDPEFADAPYDGARAQAYMIMAKTSFQMYEEAQSVLEAAQMKSAEDFKKEAVKDALGQVQIYWKKSRNDCGTHLEFGEYEDGSVKLTSAFFCHDRLCALCGWRKSMKEKFRLESALDWIKETKGEYTYIFLTLTVPNVSDDQLRPMLKHMHWAFNKMRGESWWKESVIGWYRSDEVTHTKKRDLIKRGEIWHPHIHLVIAVSDTYFKDGTYMTQDQIRRSWHRYMSFWCDAQQVWIEKIKPKGDSEAAGDGVLRRTGEDIHVAVVETTKYMCKSTDYLVKDRKETAARVEVLREALDCVHMTGSGGVIAEGLQVVDAKNGLTRENLINVSGDEDIAEEPVYDLLVGWRRELGAYVVEARMPHVVKEDSGEQKGGGMVTRMFVPGEKQMRMSV